jgi:hypothetical protein
VAALPLLERAMQDDDPAVRRLVIRFVDALHASRFERRAG